MRLHPTERFRRHYLALPESLQQRVDRQLEFLLQNLRHPSLRTKKMEGTDGIWELRVTKGYRLTFTIQADAYLLRAVGTHDILRSP